MVFQSKAVTARRRKPREPRRGAQQSRTGIRGGSLICFFVFLFFGSLFLSSVGRMIFESRAVTARRRKPRETETQKRSAAKQDRN